MSPRPQVILSGFADESANSKKVHEQLAVFAALGLEYYSLRFIDLGQGIKNVMQLSDTEAAELKRFNNDYGLKVTCIGSPLGKVKLRNVEDGTKNRFVAFDHYMQEDVKRAVQLAQFFETKLIRGFSFYPPKGANPELYFEQAVEHLAKIAAYCQQEGVVYGLEIEANLMGATGAALARLYREVNNPAMVLIYDGANLSCQNYPAAACFNHYMAMREGLGWMHIKDYRIDPRLKWEGHVDEERLKNFVPCDEGDSGYEMVLRDFKSILPQVTKHMQALGAPGVFLDLEPHLKGGGQFGGFSGPDGMGVALRALTNLLDYVGIGYALRDYTGLKR